MASDLDALLRRIGLPAAPPPTIFGLHAVHRAWVSSVPFEDITIQLGQQRPLDLAAVTERLIAPGGRGGYCFEVNGVLALLLEELGFTVERRRAIVGPRGADAPVNHLALVVSLGGQRLLAEAGYGEGWLHPLSLRAGEQGDWTVAPEGDGAWWVGDQRDWTGGDGLTILPGAVDMTAFEEPHRRLSTSPDSGFVRTLVVQQPHDDLVATLRARTLTIRSPLVDESRVLEDARDLDATLRACFGIALDRAAVAQLWDAACDQHDAWRREQSAA
jgi:N-hydroxyarylamine O-acetyltransferase